MPRRAALRVRGAPGQPRFVFPYYRVSTAQQGASGLGLEAQREAVVRHVRTAGGVVVAEFKEVESGKKNDRPQIAAAIAACRLRHATLIIAKLDRLARNVQFISSLMESGVDFVACDNPHATRLTIHILAAVAEHEREREMISARTVAALAIVSAAIAANGTWTSRRSGQPITRLGNPNLRAGSRSAARTARQARTDLSDAHAADILPLARPAAPRWASSPGCSAPAASAPRPAASNGSPSRSAGSWRAPPVSNRSPKSDKPAKIMPILFRLRTAGALLLAALLTTQAAAQHAGRAGQASTTQSVKVVSGDGTIMRPPVIPADDTTLAPPLAPQAAAAAVSGITTDEGLWTFGTPAYASGDYPLLINGSAAGWAISLQVTNGKVYAKQNNGNIFVRWSPQAAWLLAAAAPVEGTVAAKLTLAVVLPKIPDNSPAGTVIAKATVAMSPAGAKFTGPLVSSNPLFVGNGANVVLARTLTAADDGPQVTMTVNAVQ